MVMAAAQAAYTRYPEYHDGVDSPQYTPPSDFVNPAEANRGYDQPAERQLQPQSPFAQRRVGVTSPPAVTSRNNRGAKPCRSTTRYDQERSVPRLSEDAQYPAPSEKAVSFQQEPPYERGRLSAPAGPVPSRHLRLKEQDQRHRVDGAPQRPGYCVDELCSCNQHQCLRPRKPIPFDYDTTYRTVFKNKGLRSREEQLAELLDPSGVPHGVDPNTWRQYIEKHGIPPLGNLPACLFYNPSPDTRDFVTEARAQFLPKNIEGPRQPLLYGPDGVPYGVDPKRWREYLEKYGAPPDSGHLPAYLFYKSTPDTRDFGTECRSQFTAKPLAKQRDPTAFWGGDIDNPPPGIDAALWKHYVSKFGLPAIGSILPSWLYHPSRPDTRDFVTNYRGNYVPYTINVCPVARLPPYPIPSWPREHTFWDPVAKKWY